MLLKFAEFLSECPYLEDSRINVNYLNKESASVSVELRGTRNIVRKYADGGRLKKAIFLVSLRELVVLTEGETIQTVEKCRGIENWIEEQNKNGSLPMVKENAVPVSMEVIKEFEIVGTHKNFARYEAEVELIYY